MPQIKSSTWDDNLLFYGGEALVLLVAEGVIIRFSYESVSDIPFCLGLMLTALVAGIGMHWALTKYTPWLKGVGYSVWLGLTLLVGVVSGVLWTAHDREKAHLANQTVAAQSAAVLTLAQARAQAEKIKAEGAARAQQLGAVGDLLGKTKGWQERQSVLRIGRTVNPTPTPTPQPQAEPDPLLAVPAVTAEPAAEWKPFQPGSVLEFVHESLTRFCSVAGVLGLALMLGAFVIFKEHERAARLVVTAGNATTHVVTTAAPSHSNSPAVGFGAGFRPSEARASDQQPPMGNPGGRQM